MAPGMTAPCCTSSMMTATWLDTVHVSRTTVPDGQAIINVFSADGPTQCSGLAVRRYSALELAAVLAPEFTLDEVWTAVHATPAGREQEFLTAVFSR